MPGSAKKLIKHIMKWLWASTLLYTCFTAHIPFPVLASIHYNAGCPANGEEMIFISWEETRRDNHTPIPSESPAVNFTSTSLRLQLTSEGVLHVLCMRWKGWKRWKPRGEDGEGVITQRWNHGKELSSASLLFVQRDILAWAVRESGKHIDTRRLTRRHTHTDLMHSQKTGFLNPRGTWELG